jgi:plastocyanin
MRTFAAAVMMALSVTVAGCGSTYSDSPVSPSPTPTPVPTRPTETNGVVTVDVLFENGAQSFSPDPTTLPAGQLVAWRNTDRVTHRIVLNDGSLDTGDLRPGASSNPLEVPALGGAYHCSIHPSMVGTINRSAPQP